MLACIYNSIIMGWRVGIRLDGSGVTNAANGDTIQLRNNIFAGNVRLGDSAGSSFSTTAWLTNPPFNNTIYSLATDVQLTNPFGVYPEGPAGPVVNNWMPITGSPALSGADFTNPNLSGFDIVSFRGAFGSNNWTQNWAVFNPRDYIIGVKQISSNVPARFNLEQNYPNPFNPTTNIMFELPVSGFVTLKVYNSIGEEVKTLANQDLAAGTYRVDFDATGLPSGVYFYNITVQTQSAKFTETRKMMLVK
jgi:hypothetical protein